MCLTYSKVKIFNYYLQNKSVKKNPGLSTQNKSQSTQTPIVVPPKVLISNLPIALLEMYKYNWL